MEFVGDILCLFLKYLKGIEHLNDHIKGEISKHPLIIKKEISSLIKEIIQKNSLTKENIEAVLNIILEIICESPINMSQYTGHLIKNQHFLEIFLALLNFLHKFPEWRSVVTTYTNFFIVSFRNSHMNYYNCSNVNCYYFICIVRYL